MENKYKEVFPNNDLNNEETFKAIFMANGLYPKSEIQWYTKFSRHGNIIDPYNSLSGCREYLFFTKPDLHIVEPYTDKINPELQYQPYFVELLERYPSVIDQLQQSNRLSVYLDSPFMPLLSNSLNNTLDLSAISASTIDNPQTIYGTAYNYRGWGWTSDEKIEFSLEFKDTKYLEVYNLFKAYEEYERLKHIGMVTPPNLHNAEVVNGKSFNYYTKNKILHDQFSIYKFIVEDDGMTIVYYAKLWGVFIKSVPRDAFSDLKADNGITYSVDFEAAFVDDMNPLILRDFNKLVESYISKTKDFPLYNKETRMMDNRYATMPVIRKVLKENNPVWDGPNSMKHMYRLEWRL